MDEGASANTIVNNICWYNCGAGVSEGSAAAGPTSDNIVLANDLSRPAGWTLDVGGGSVETATKNFVALGNDVGGGGSGTHGEVLRGVFSLNKHCAPPDPRGPYYSSRANSLRVLG
jgi:hypothetical protein